MAGHSQFKNIMHRKGRQDAMRSKLFSKLAREITVAAKLGLPDPGMNARLRLDGFPWAQFGTIEAKVSHVAAEIRDNMVRVEFMPVAAPARNIVMQHGLPGSVEVAVEQTSPALLILRAAGQMASQPAQPPQPAQIAQLPAAPAQ